MNDLQNDERLIELTLAGDRASFGDLIRKYQDRLFTSLVYVLRDAAEAEDVAQEAFILALTKLHTFKGASQFYTWLYRIAYNVAVTRKRRRKTELSLDNDTTNPHFELPSSDDQPSDHLLATERAEQLNIALGRLSEQYRMILVMREMESMDYSAIAETLDLPVGTVKSRLYRARLQLKELLETVV